MTGECYHTYLEMQVFKKKVLEGQGGSGNTDVSEIEGRGRLWEIWEEQGQLHGRQHVIKNLEEGMRAVHRSWYSLGGARTGCIAARFWF